MWPLVLLLFAPQYELKGRLEPAVHASISLQSTSTAFSTSVLSNPEGRFRFTKLNSGTYTVIVFAPGMGEMRTSVDVGPSTPEVTIRLSQARDTGAEHKVSAKALSIPSKAWSEYRAADRSLARNQTAQAIQHLERATQLAPQFSPAWNHLGTIAYKSRRYQEAVQHFQRALEADPEAYEPLVNLGGALLNVGRISEAWNYNVHAVLARPEDALANSQLGMTYFVMGKQDLAIHYLKEARRIDPGHFSQPQLLLAEIYLRRNQPAEAALVLDEFLRVHPDHPNAWAIREQIGTLRKP